MCFGRTIPFQNSRKLAYRNIQTKKLLRGITGGGWRLRCITGGGWRLRGITGGGWRLRGITGGGWRRFRSVYNYMEGLQLDIL